MGRRDAVAFVLEVVAEARRILPRLQVDFLDGWASRGNGTSADYEGLLVHHTASASSQTRPFPTKDLLVGGRGGTNPLSGPLANLGGPWCTVDSPRLVVVAAHPANHAGASGGRSMGPLPVTKLFNPKVLGLEIDYAGTSAMTAGQLLVAQVVGRAVTNVLRRPSPEWVRAHAETSITGKWDIGYASGRTVDMAGFRAGVWNVTTAAAPADAPPVPEEHPEMKVIQSDKRGIALVGAGYYRQLVDAEDVISATMLWGPPHVDNERRFDVWVTQATQGTASATTGQLTALAAQVAGIKQADVDEQALADLLAPKLSGASAREIADALREVLRTGTDG